MDVKQGDIVRWTSQSSGVTKTKEGVVAAVIPANVNPFDNMRDVSKLLRATPKSRIKFDGGKRDVIRVLVQVPRGGKSRLSDFYCPHISVVKLVEVPANDR